MEGQRRGRRYSRELRLEILNLIGIAQEGGARLGRACGVVGISIRTLQRWKLDPEGEDRRRGPKRKPKHALTDVEKKLIVSYANSPEHRNLSPEQVVAKLATVGIYVCSESSLRRILKEHAMDTRRDRAKPPTQRHKPRPHVANGPMQVLAWDITYLRNITIRGSYFFLYLFLDVWSRKIVGWSVHEEQTSMLAAQLLQSICAEHSVEGLVVHSDNGAPMKGSTMLATFQHLGIVSSFSRPSVSNDNAFPESLFRHLKYVPAFPREGFVDLDEARAWVARFVDWYNHEHLHSSIAYVTPASRHDGSDQQQLQRRRDTYAKARARCPRRWTGNTRPWESPTVVVLNPEQTVQLKPATPVVAAGI